jgi:hypothetical protein
MSLCTFCQHSKQFDGHIYCKKNNNAEVDLLNITSCKHAYEAPEDEKPAENSDEKQLKKEQIHAGDIVYSVSYHGIRAYIVVSNTNRHILGAVIIPLDETVSNIEDYALFANPDDAIDFYKRANKFKIEKDYRESLDMMEREVIWFKNNLKEKRWEYPADKEEE